MEMRDSTICEKGESTICESEHLHFESMSDTPSELRVAVDRSSEAIPISNNLPSTSSVFSHAAIGSMDDATPILEKMYMVYTHVDSTPCFQDDEDVAYMEATTTSTPTSHEREYKGMHIGVVDDAMIPLVDMMTCECLHVMDDAIDITYDLFIFPCNALPLHNDEHVEFDCDDISMNMPCYECFTFPRFVDNKDKI
jgi:hypothetical protein